MNQFPHDFPHTLTGFGGDSALDQAQHRERCRKCPVILVHGNATHSADPKYGMLAMKAFLKDAGYQDCELWCCDYLGENNTAVVLPDVHRKHIDAVRDFIDGVRAYLGVQKVDFIGHSLGCGMVNAYLRGLQPDGRWNNDDHRLDTAGTFVSIAGAQYGLGTGSVFEFKTGSDFEVLSHRFGDVASDDTPAGTGDLAEQTAPVADWIATTALDDRRVCYVAIIARGDFVDQQHADTSRRNGAELNKVVSLGAGAEGHEKVIKNQAVFDACQGYLNRHPPVPPVIFSVDRESGSYGANLQVTVTVAPAGATIAFAARRLTRAVAAGFLTDSVAQTRDGALSDGQSLALEHDGAWDVRFTAGTGATLERTYGVNVLLPELQILTDNGTPFQGSLEVTATASKGTVFHSTDAVRWLAGSNPVIYETSTLYFIAIDAAGLASPIVSRAFEKKPVPFVKATLTEHFIAHRLEVGDYVSLTLELGANAVITLYFVNGDWVRDPDVLETVPAAPTLTLSEEGGVKTEPFTLTMAARHATDAAPAIYYTLDGSLPTRHAHRFTSSGRLRFETAGTTELHCRACDAAGNWSDTVSHTYRLELGHAPLTISCDKPGGLYPHAFHAVIAVPDAQLPVYYTEDGSDPSDGANPNRQTFAGCKRFSIRGNGRHAIRCHARDSAGNEASAAFGWEIDDEEYPDTCIAPSAGGSFVGKAVIELSVSEPCEWTRYTLDGSEPSERHGETYVAPIVLDRSARLRFRSRSPAGKLEPVRTAVFTVARHPDRLVFDSDARHTGYLVAAPGHARPLVGTGNVLRIGAVAIGGAPPPVTGDSRASARAILQFDTSALPDNVTISHACLEVAFHAKSGDPWAGGRTIEIDVQRGHFGASRALHGGDWHADATAAGVAQLGGFTSGTCRSADFSPAGLAAINRTGTTQLRLRMTYVDGQPDACLMLAGGHRARLCITLASVDA